MATTNVTLCMMLDESKRVLAIMEKHYPTMVRKKKLNPYQRDHRLAVHRKLVDLLQQAKDNKNTDRPKFMDLLNNLPNE